jgi:septal ring-binding cell division protein DamX
MTDSVDPLQPLAAGRKFSGIARVVLAFIMGTLFALLPIYYFYTGRDLRTTAASPAEPLNPAPETPRAAGATAPAARFAGRMTYELSHTPAEPVPAPVRMTAPAPAQTPPAQIATARVTAASPAPAAETNRIQNARPISAAPPDPRDTTRAMEKEARGAGDREPQSGRLASPTVAPVQPRVVEGRDIVLPPKPAAVPTRSIGAAPSGDTTGSRTEPARLEVATVGSGTSPGGAAPESKAEPQQTTPADAPRASADLRSRLAATREWLGSAAQTTLTIQLMGGNSEEQLKAQLKSLTGVLEPSKIYVYRTVAQGKPSLTVVYGAYADRKAALEAIDKLPPAIAANRPVLRTVSGIRNEQKQHGMGS